MPQQLYPSKPVYNDWALTIVRVDPVNLSDAYDKLWVSFTNGYTGQQLREVSLDRLREMYPWAGYVKKLSARLDKALNFYGYGLETRAFLQDLVDLVPEHPAVPENFDVSNEFARAVYTRSQQLAMRQLQSFLWDFEFLYRRRGRGEWRVDTLSRVRDVRYEQVLFRVGAYINQAELARIFHATA